MLFRVNWMPRFVAFLRGINVGGRSVKKEKLKDAFSSMGFENVSTFKQSGNVIFKTNSEDKLELEGRITAKLQTALGYSVPVFLRSTEHLKRIVKLEPFKGQSIEGASFLVTFLSAMPPSTFISQLPLMIPKSTAQVISAHTTEVFSITHGGGEGALPNPFVESKLKVKATTRNLNIVRDIVEKFG
jgi:uncharacterized protein (DUF1697 family)